MVVRIFIRKATDTSKSGVRNAYIHWSSIYDLVPIVKRHWLCSLIGHKLDPELYYHMNVEHCLRGCEGGYPLGPDLEDPTHIIRLGRWRWRLGAWIAERKRAIRDWWHCPRCDGRFGCHDEDRCLPF